MCTQEKTPIHAKYEVTRLFDNTNKVQLFTNNGSFSLSCNEYKSLFYRLQEVG